MNLNDRLNALRNPQAAPTAVEPPVATLADIAPVELGTVDVEMSTEALFHAPPTVPVVAPIAPVAQPLVRHSAAVDPLASVKE